MLAQSEVLTTLTGAKYVSLTTFRKSGEAVATPMWFAASSGTIYVETGRNAGKIKRIHHTSQVTLAPCTINGTVTGASIDGRARILTEAQEIATAKEAMSRKYGLIRRLYYFGMVIPRILRRRPKSELVYIAIEVLN